MVLAVLIATQDIPGRLDSAAGGFIAVDIVWIVRIYLKDWYDLREEVIRSKKLPGIPGRWFSDVPVRRKLWRSLMRLALTPVSKRLSQAEKEERDRIFSM